MFEKLKTDLFKEYEKILNELRNELQNDKFSISQEDFSQIIRVFEWYKHDFKDIRELFEKVRKIVADQLPAIDNIYEKLQFEGLLKYLEQIQNHKYDGSSFPLVLGTLETAALSAADKVIENLDKKMKDRIKTMQLFKSTLEKIEGSYQIAYHILKKVANRYIEQLKQSVFDFPEMMQKTVLNSLEGFKNDNKVIDFFNTYIEKTKQNWLLDEARKFLNQIL